MKTSHKKLIPAILAFVLCTCFPAAYGEDTAIIDLQQDFSQRSEKLGKALEAFHDTPQARAETKQWAKEARNTLFWFTRTSISSCQICRGALG